MNKLLLSFFIFFHCHASSLLESYDFMTGTPMLQMEWVILGVVHNECIPYHLFLAVEGINVFKINSITNAIGLK